jgi:poly(A) polymerase
LAQQEELESIRPVLDGNRIMEVLGLAPGPDVGRAYAFLLEHRLDNGPVDPVEAEELLRQWWVSQQA